MKARRLFSVKDKDKNGFHRRNKSAEAGHKNHSAEFFRMFKSDPAKTSADKEDKAKIEQVQRALADANISDVSADHVRQILHSEYAAGDVDKAAEFVEMASRAAAGYIAPYNPKITMVGAENREFVTCYLDSLLFAMFARMTAYEPMLRHDFTDEPRKKLATLLRLYVNMLRSGKLVHTDMTKIIQETLAECGWPDAKELEQQDTSEAFAFITETLQLPLLQLQVDLFHHGKKDQDDHKIVQERLLNLAVPPDPEGKGLRLEDCLEEYFNTKVDVLRDSHDEKMDGRRPAASRLNTIRMVTREDDPDSPVTLTASPIQASPMPQKATENGLNGEAEEKEEQAEHVETSPAGPSRPSPRHRSTSVIQHVVVDEGSTKNVTESNTTLLARARRTSSTVVKAVTIPAWQFFRLIPWHTTSNSAPQNDHDVAMNLGQRPVVGICLKRYGLNAQNYPMRLNTYIDIPDSLKLPHFMLADDTHLEEDPNGFSTEYKLVLQSVVCHRGDSVYSGHYIAFSRVAPKLLKDNRKHDFDPPPDYEEPQWVKFDDLEYGNRVTYVEDLKKALKEEMPYLLFYQIVPVVDMASTEEADTEVEPPSYADSKTSVANSTAASLSDSGLLSSAHADDSDYFENGGASPPRERTIRFSSEIERPPRLSFDDTTDDDEIRRGRQTPARTPDTASPAVTPGTTPGDESTRDRFSRAAALFSNKSRSRPGSQAGEGRMSLTMNRLGGLIRTSKEPLRDPNSIAATVSAPPAPQGPPSGQVSARQSVDVPRASFESESRLDLKEGKSEHSTPRKHHTHRRSKSKNKGEQPERECNLM